jgi:inner membrane protein YidH
MGESDASPLTVGAGVPKSSNELAQERTDLAGRRTGLADERNRLALTRTLVALDRTLMAWVRTAVSLISFGFTIYKFFQEVAKETPSSDRLLSSRGVALVLIGIGVGSLAVATIEYRRQMAAIRERYRSYGPFERSLAPVVAAIIAGLGILGFVLVVLRQ